ncbi:hypothetical protein E8K88_14160 [Lampropedia aestuarii]|uniref:Type II secretion system protein GspC N-terminal domain-containing protein n=2 Tax=Lampropedia aestuarii TaxID=2562762 RepID=A0A4S5BHD7_9BURK|nr:hypothetical protein E8K88_14160 [Lampropedia aestuarii]
MTIVWQPYCMDATQQSEYLGCAVVPFNRFVNHNRVMQISMLQNRLFQGVSTSAVWALAVGSVVYWVLSMPGAGAHEASGSVATNALVADSQGMRRLLGAIDAPVVAAEAAPAAATQLALVGVVAGTQSGQGAALIAVNGQPARTVRVGHRLQGEQGLYLQSLQGRVAYLGPDLAGPSTVELVLPEFKTNQVTPVAAARNATGRVLGSQPLPAAPLRQAENND